MSPTHSTDLASLRTERGALGLRDQVLNCLVLLFSPIFEKDPKEQGATWKSTQWPITDLPHSPGYKEDLQLLFQWPGDQLDHAVSLRPGEPGTIWREGHTPGLTAGLPVKLMGTPGLEFGQQQRFLWGRRRHTSVSPPDWGSCCLPKTWWERVVVQMT